MLGEVAGRFAFRGEMAFSNTRARRNPLVARVDKFFEFGIGDDPFRQIAAGTGDAGVDQRSIPQQLRLKTQTRRIAAD